MIHVAETLTIGSVENFLTGSEIARLVTLMDTHMGAHPSGRFDVLRDTSIHEIPGHTAEQAKLVYEPAGRVELTAIPDEAESILSNAYHRARSRLARLIPSVTDCRPWTYVEYGPGQHITSHLDGIAPDPLSWPRQIAGISVVVAQPASGGDFFVETTAADALWEAPHHGDGYHDGMVLARDGADNSAAWFRQLPRTRWSVSAGNGDALIYGSQLAHGTEPVQTGRARKFISWLVAERGD